MKLQKDDVRLMQFVLNEISNIDRDIVAQALVNQPEIAEEIAEIKKLIDPVHRMSSEPNNLQLTAAQKQNLFAQTIYSKAHAKAKIGFLAQWQWLIGGLTAVAFSVLVFNKSMFKEAQTVPHAESSNQESYVPTKQSEIFVKPEAAPKGGAGLATETAAPAPPANEVADLAEEKDDAKVETEVAAAEGVRFKESELHPQDSVAPAKTVAIPTHDSGPVAMKKDAEPPKMRKQMTQSAKASASAAMANKPKDVDTVGLLSAFGEGHTQARAKVYLVSKPQGETLGTADSKSKKTTPQYETEIASPTAKNFKATATLKQSVFNSAQFCLANELVEMAVVIVKFFPPDKKIRIYLSRLNNTISNAKEDQQNCMITALTKLPWNEATEIDIVIRNVSR